MSGSPWIAHACLHEPEKAIEEPKCLHATAVAVYNICLRAHTVFECLQHNKGDNTLHTLRVV